MSGKGQVINPIQKVLGCGALRGGARGGEMKARGSRLVRSTVSLTKVAASRFSFQIWGTSARCGACLGVLALEGPRTKDALALDQCTVEVGLEPLIPVLGPAPEHRQAVWLTLVKQLPPRFSRRLAESQPPWQAIRSRELASQKEAEDVEDQQLWELPY